MRGTPSTRRDNLPRHRRGVPNAGSLEQHDCQFISHQAHYNHNRSGYHGHILRMRDLYPTKPILNIEFLYEMGQLHTCTCSLSWLSC